MKNPVHPDASSAVIHALVEGLRVERLPSDAPSFGPLTLLDRGDIIGRHVILAPLGHGGMGVVYAAYDPELDRKVALKLLLPKRGSGRDDAGRARLLREAQALARLAHPNVVAVYDVGMQDERVWITMEFVAGQTLGEWAREKPRRWPEIVPVLADVARGMAAAHAAGLVHRDLKPDNVMIDGKGRVRVMDFGLAHGRASVADHELASTFQSNGESQPETAALTLRLTHAGALNGTPAYMAPEQWRGQEASAAADQFGWSVMAWELLFGERPFAGDSLDELAAAVLAGRRRSPPQGRRVPGWLRLMIERGLVATSSQRWPTMSALLTELERGRTRAWVKTAIFVGMGVVAMSAGAFGYEQYAEAQQVSLCEAEGASIAEVWNQEVQTKLRDGLLATGVSYAGTTAEKVMPYFDAQAKAWREARKEVCLDARVRGTLDETILDQAVWCLDERRMELEALIAELSKTSAASVQNAVPSAAGLSQVGPCQDANRLGMLPLLPKSRESVQAVRRTLSRAIALRAAGEYMKGLDIAHDALTAADGLGWPPLIAAVRWRYGDLLAMSGKYSEAESELENAFFQAAEVGAIEDAADAAVSLTFIVGYLQRRHDDGVRWSRHATVVQVGLGETEDNRRAEALNSLAVVQSAMGAHLVAKGLHRRALTIWEDTLGPYHPSVATSLNNLAGVHQDMGELQEAKALHRRAADIREAALGPDHPSLANSLTNLATVYEDMDAHEEAKALHVRALYIMERALGPDHPDLATTLNNLAVTCSSMGEYDEAKLLLERARLITEKALGSAHPQLTSLLNNLANVHRNMQSYEEAKALYERALTIDENALGPDHPHVATTLNNFAFFYDSRGAYKESKALNERALAILEKVLEPGHLDIATSLNNLAAVQFSLGAYLEADLLDKRALAIREEKLGPDHPDLASPLTGLAMVALAQHRPADALLLAGRAVRIRESANVPTDSLAGSRFVLAQALWDALPGKGRDRPLALALARQARDSLSEAWGNDKKLAEMEAFLAKHEGTL